MELHATIHEDSDGSYWAEVKELPGCFASGTTISELTEALLEAVNMCLESAPERKRKRRPARARLDEMKLVTA
jgi:predicted RNase H-like HicB family nuclease